MWAGIQTWEPLCEYHQTFCRRLGGVSPATYLLDAKMKGCWDLHP